MVVGCGGWVVMIIVEVVLLVVPMLYSSSTQVGGDSCPLCVLQHPPGPEGDSG